MRVWPPRRQLRSGLDEHLPDGQAAPSVGPAPTSPRGHRTRMRTEYVVALGLRSLADEPMILIDISPGEAFYRAILSAAGGAPRVVHQTSSVEGVRALVARGFGWSMLLQQSRTKLSYEGRAYRELDIADEVPDVALLAVTLRGRLTRRTVACLDYCTELFAATN